MCRELIWFAVLPGVIAVPYFLLPLEPHSFLEVLTASVATSMVLRFGIVLDTITHSRSQPLFGRSMGRGRRGKRLIG